MTFDQAFEYTDKIQGGFERICCEKLWQYAIEARGAVAEVGVGFGRSASLLLRAARDTKARVVLVDIWPEGERTYEATQRVLADFPDVPVDPMRMPSVDAARLSGLTFSLVHIDGNHYGTQPDDDCKAWLPHLQSGGIACFHDYGVEYPAVTEAVDANTIGWENLGSWATLAIRRKP